ncbi:hypothetical protein PsYK624_044080 [Phanerochaete sordida]|uniref:Uncharacterized protein n=1 Tax=Phanerochaete sordida TaxID=48140 RepID=A0A9P3G5Q9_9APHY|nr:hypothetical protein PsYK624_044080 [Phanerochaete sordida]
MPHDGRLKVVFGPAPDSYFVTYGKRYAWNNAPESLVQTFQANSELDPMNVAWISIHPSNEYWAVKTVLGDNLYVAPRTPDTLLAHLRPTSDAHSLTEDKAQALSFTADGRGFFVRRAQRGYVLELGGAPYALDVAELRASIPDFDARVRDVLFGRDGTWICVYRDAGFTANLDGPAQDPEHPLHKVCKELTEEAECRVLEGSVLSPHDDRHFVLRVQIGDKIVTRWNLPDAMLAVVNELVERTNDPAEQALIEQSVMTSANNAMMVAQIQADIQAQGMRTVQDMFRPYTTRYEYRWERR